MPLGNIDWNSVPPLWGRTLCSMHRAHHSRPFLSCVIRYSDVRAIKTHHSSSPFSELQLMARSTVRVAAMAETKINTDEVLKTIADKVSAGSVGYKWPMGTHGGTFPQMERLQPTSSRVPTSQSKPARAYCFCTPAPTRNPKSQSAKG